MTDKPSAPDVVRLVADHHAELYRYAYRLAGSAADAEDLTQQVFLQVHRKIHQLKDAHRARGWLFAVLRNCFLASRRKQTPISAGSVDLQIERVPQPVRSAEAIDQERLQAALDDLPPEFRIVLVMFYFEDCSYREIAERLDLPAGTVMSRLARAKGHLRKRLADPATVSGRGDGAARHSLASDRGYARG